MTTPVGAVASTAAAAASGTSTANGARGSGSPTGTGQLSSDAFLRLLVAQLKYQDPSSPADMNAFMTETATLNQMQTMQQLASVSSNLLQQSQAAQAMSLIGKTVGYTASDGTAASGVVSAVALNTQPPSLTVGGASVPISSVTSVIDPTATPSSATTTDPTTTTPVPQTP